MPALAIDALAQRAGECLLRPAADAGLRVRGDIGRVDRSERSWQGEAAGKDRAARSGVARVAVAKRRELGASFDRCFRKRLGFRRLDWLNGRTPCQDSEECDPQDAAEDDQGRESLEDSICYTRGVA